VAASAPDQTVLFASRFLEAHAGPAILKDPITAIVELVANAWDAGARNVAISWPDESTGQKFSIEDDGHGMTDAEFLRRWFTVSYDRLEEQGGVAQMPEPKEDEPQRPAFGRNGLGRYAVFCFAESYTLTTWRDGKETAYRVTRGIESPLAKGHLGSKKRTGHGTRIEADTSRYVALSPSQARAEIGMRFLTDPHFAVSLDGVRIAFDDLPKTQVDVIKVDGGAAGPITITVLDTRETDRTSKQHGIAWHVKNRLVGKCSWEGTGHEKFLDGRRAEAKRYTFIVQAGEVLETAVSKDWQHFYSDHPLFREANEPVQDAIRNKLIELTQEKRTATVRAVREALGDSVARLTPLGREKWTEFVDNAVIACPSLTEKELTQLGGVLVNLEESRSKYGLIQQLHDLKPDDLDELHRILRDWTLRFAKIVLDEVAGRLRLVDELQDKVLDPATKEVQELQPLFKRGLWIFGPEFETIEYTSNVGMTTVIQQLCGGEQKGSLNRPDFAILPDSTVGLYSYPRYDNEGGEVGIDRLVIIELKRPGVRISTDEKGQAWKYVIELYEKGQIQDSTRVMCFVLGSEVHQVESNARIEMDGRVVIQPLTYTLVLQRAKSRMLKLYDRVKEAPFLDDHAVETFLNGDDGQQRSLFAAPGVEVERPHAMATS
jgi:hypothetical protein